LLVASPVAKIIARPRYFWQPAHQYVMRLLSPWPRLRIGAPQRGQGRPARA
jgi:hypothetical protein